MFSKSFAFDCVLSVRVKQNGVYSQSHWGYVLSQCIAITYGFCFNANWYAACSNALFWNDSITYVVVVLVIIHFDGFQSLFGHRNSTHKGRVDEILLPHDYTISKEIFFCVQTSHTNHLTVDQWRWLVIWMTHGWSCRGHRLHRAHLNFWGNF